MDEPHPGPTTTLKPAAHLSLGLCSFLKSEHLPLPLPPPPSRPVSPGSGALASHSGRLSTLSIEEHHRRSSCHFPDIFSDTRTPPLSPAESAYSALYPPPPHLTPQASPTASPRAESPAFPDGDDHPAVPTTHLLGKLTITVVEARGLACETGNEKPYVLLQYDRTDSVSREYGAAPVVKNEKRTSKIAAKALARKAVRPGLKHTQSASALATTTVRRVGGQARAQEKNEPPSPPPETSPKEIGTPHAPIFNHIAQFDVVQPDRTILLCLYDKLAPIGGFPAHGFLGASVFEPPLPAEAGNSKEEVDVWVPLTSAIDPTVGGEVRIKVLFETLQSRPKLTVDDFQVLKLIGQGSFGQVFRVRKRDTKRIYAMKVITKESIASKSQVAQVLAERQVLARTLNSPFLVGLKFCFQNVTDLFFVMDYKGGGELFCHLQNDGGRFEESKVRFYLCEIILALEYLHNAGIIYRDLKPENCLLDGLGHCVLVDFGLSKLMSSSEESTRTLCGTTAFMAPEVLLDVGYNWRCDWWSLGVLLFEMCYDAETRVEEYERILKGPIKIPTKRGYSAENKDLLLKLLTRDPNQRIGAGGASEIQAHAFFDSIDWRAVALRQISPPYKPPTLADDDEYACERGRSGDWMFSVNGQCWGASQRPSMNDKCDLDSEGLFRDFTFTATPRHDVDGDELSSSRNRRSSWSGAP
ncbi:AGC/Akt protein kinase [Pseudohyphozyma bogoriensis]|nr:AGC/Akt protein kinase [Pseudohyphozyma bogoriensis]